MEPRKVINLAILDNTISKKKLSSGYARGEKSGRFSGLGKVTIDGVSIRPIIIDPFEPPLNPIRNMHSLYSGIDPLRALRVFFRLREYDAIMAIGESSALVLILLRKIFKFKTPIIIMDPAISYSWKMRARVLDVVIPKADRLLLRGDNQAKYLSGKYGDCIKSAIIYHRIDTDYYKPTESIAGDYILAIGNDVGRDYSTFIRAVKDLDIEVIIKTNEININNEDMPDNIRIIKNRISFDELKNLYASAKFVVIPMRDSIHACGVNSILESMAMGKATIISNSQGIRDYYVEDKTSLVVEPEDVASLKSAICELMKNDDKAREMGRCARLFVENNFSSKIYTKGFAKAIVDTVKDVEVNHHG